MAAAPASCNTRLDFMPQEVCVAVAAGTEARALASLRTQPLVDSVGGVC